MDITKRSRSRATPAIRFPRRVAIDDARRLRLVRSSRSIIRPSAAVSRHSSNPPCYRYRFSIITAMIHLALDNSRQSPFGVPLARRNHRKSSSRSRSPGGNRSREPRRRSLGTDAVTPMTGNTRRTTHLTLLNTRFAW